MPVAKIIENLCPVKWNPGRFPWVASCGHRADDVHIQHMTESGAVPPKGEWYIDAGNKTRRFRHGEEIIDLDLRIGLDGRMYLVCINHVTADGVCTERWEISGGIAVRQAVKHAQGG
jgi:hypothetical protein